MIPFNKPCHTGFEEAYIAQAISAGKLSGDGEFTKKCSHLLVEKTKSSAVLLTTSCSHALDMSAILLDIKPGDEVILPSFTFVSTANAFVLRGARIVFVDIRPDTMNINELLIEDAITTKTKAIVPVHYAGVACEMDTILGIARNHNLAVVEDAAQGVNATYKGRSLGAIGDLGAYSFHETKNYVCGEGGAILVNRPDLVEKAEIVREKGTNRSRFFRGQIDKYTWVDLGSSYLPSELNAAYLFAQLERMELINDNRLKVWDTYFERFSTLHDKGLLELPNVPAECTHNAHMFYIKLKDLETRTSMIEHLKQRNISSAFHYIPLHSSPAGIRFGRFHGEDQWTTKDSDRLLRLPLYYRMTNEDQEIVIDAVNSFFV